MEVAMTGYDNLVWIRDKNGKEYSCSADVLRNNLKDGDELTEDERARCVDVSEIIGTERW